MIRGSVSFMIYDRYISCPLCDITNVLCYFEDQNRRYFQCFNCKLVFVDPSQRLSAFREKEEYDLHQNMPKDPAYRKFLSRLYLPLKNRIAIGTKGLDFGCGDGPALSQMFSEAGFLMNNYDIFYCDDKKVLQDKYGFITATEVVEHLFNPGRVLRQLWAQRKSVV